MSIHIPIILLIFIAQTSAQCFPCVTEPIECGVPNAIYNGCANDTCLGNCSSCIDEQCLVCYASCGITGLERSCVLAADKGGWGITCVGYGSWYKCQARTDIEMTLGGVYRLVWLKVCLAIGVPSVTGLILSILLWKRVKCCKRGD